jgi:hypothetical protein
MRKWFIASFVASLFVFVAAYNTIALKYSLFYELPWLDMPLHFLGGFVLGLGALWVYFYSGFYTKILYVHRTAGYVVSLAVISALALGGLWEVYEYGIDIANDAAATYDMFDTLSDFFFDVLGSLFAALFFISGNDHTRKHG